MINVCGKCGMSHGKLGIRIEGRTMFRTADKSRHMLTKLATGHAWSFDAQLLERHREVDYIIISDRNTAETWRVDRATFDRNSFDFNGGGTAQKALSVRFWDDGEGHHHDAEPEPAGVQMILGLGTPQRTVYEKARKPRPRLEPKRRHWWG